MKIIVKLCRGTLTSLQHHLLARLDHGYANGLGRQAGSWQWMGRQRIREAQRFCYKCGKWTPRKGHQS